MEGVGSAPKTTEYTYDPEPYFQTQYRILTGRELAERVLQTLDLRTLPDLNGSEPPRRGVAELMAACGHGRRLGCADSPAARPPAAVGAAVARGRIAQFSSRVSVEPVRASRLVDVSFVVVGCRAPPRAPSMRWWTSTSRRTSTSGSRT